jgi:putative alpha-1,2-mannosidase
LDPKYYEGKELVIETRNNSKEHVFVQSVSLNGKKIDNCWIDRSLLMKGGSLVWEMGPQPNTKWGTATPPPSMSTTK